MNSQDFSEWLATLSLSTKIHALALIYSKLTIHTRELFVPDWTSGKEKRVQEILHRLNEIHHTLSNYLAAYTMDEREAFPVHVLSKQLLEIENQYHLESFLTPAIESARTRISKLPRITNP